MTLRISGQPGSPTLLPENANLRGLTLIFQGIAPGEVRYRGTAGGQAYLVREAALENAAGLQQESSLLQALEHPYLPEWAQAFDQDGFFYLVTRFPQGVRMDQRGAWKNVTEPIWLEWAHSMEALLRQLESRGVFLQLCPESVLKTRDGKLKLIDLRTAGSGTLADSRKSLARLLGNAQPSWSKAEKLLTRWRFGHDGGASAAAGPQDKTSRRIPLPDDPRRTVLPPGTRLATYEVEYLTRGGMSLCYLGRSPSGTRFLKEVPCEDLEAAEALKREFEVTRKLKHPNLARSYQIFEQDGYLYLVMDYIEGKSLAELCRETQLDEERLLECAFQLCKTLDYLHTQDPPLIYRDLKPSNVVLSADGRPHLIDFGFARTYKAGQAKDTQALGTFSTASPEHFTGQTDGRSDVFSLGATLYLVAHAGFKPTAPFVFPPLRAARPDLSQAFESLVKRCVESKPDARWPSARALQAELDKQLEPFRARRGTEIAEVPDVQDLAGLPNLNGLLARSTRRLAQLVDKGSTPAEALTTLVGESENAALGQLWKQTAAVVRTGKSLPAAFRAYPKVFPAAYLAKLEEAGLDAAATLLEKEEEARATRPAPASEPAPLESRPQYRVQKGLLLAVLGLLCGYASHQQFGTWLAAAQGAVGFWGVSLGAWAWRDARRLRVLRKTQNLVEDAWTSFELGETDKAERELSEALVLSRDKLGADHLNTLASLHSLANLCRERRQYKQAHEYFTQALALYERGVPKDHIARANLHKHWGLNYEAQAQLPAALGEFEKSLGILEGLADRHPLELSEVQFLKGRVHFVRGEDRQAIELFSQCLEHQYAQVGLKSPLVHQTMSYLTRVYVRQKLFRESEKHLATLLEEGERTLQPNYRALAEANVDMGLVRLEEGRKREAEPYFLRALQLLQHYVGPNEELLQRVLNGYVRVLDGDQLGVIQLISIFAGDRELVRQALTKNPELVNTRDNTGWGPIQWATFVGRDDIVRWLLDRGADPGYDSGSAMGPLHVACAWDRSQAFFLLLEKDPDVNASGPGGWTPLFWSCVSPGARLLEPLLKKGVNVHHTDDQGRTALHVAAAHGRVNTVGALLAAGCRVDVREPLGGGTPLHVAAERGHLAVCDCLVYNGADLRLKDASGQTALQLARRSGNPLLYRALHKHLQQGLGKATGNKAL